MNIEWTITKKRGNFRPVLRYTVTLSDFEKNMAMPMVRVESSIPKPPDSSWCHCWPGQNERGAWEDQEFHLLMTPSHKTGEHSDTLKLPWREDNEYPEVEASFESLRRAFEAVLAKTADSPPMQAQGSMETTSRTKKAIAPAFAAERLLQVVKG